MEVFGILQYFSAFQSLVTFWLPTGYQIAANEIALLKVSQLRNISSTERAFERQVPCLLHSIKKQAIACHLAIVSKSFCS